MKQFILRYLYTRVLSRPVECITYTRSLFKACVSVKEKHLRSLYTNIDMQRGNFSTSCISLKKRNSTEEDKIDEDLTEDNLQEDTDYNELMTRLGGNLNGINSVVVLQPWVKWGSKKRNETTRETLLDEACALVKSLPFTSVCHKEVVPLQIVGTTHLFGKGTMQRLSSIMHASQAQAVFVSLKHLTRVQKCQLEAEFGRPVFDRYFIVLAIFKHHASTLEARLQIAMAELPFMSKRYLHEKEKLILDRREAKLKLALKRIETRRERVRTTRKNSRLPSVAVVGYTNCGKTTLIRALTGDERAQGEDRLFATLDVTAHKGNLPCGLSTLFLDSVGFIQEIPTSLIASFRATLQDTIYADVVIHVRDISHPDVANQTRTVEETFKSLPLQQDTPIVVVNNKVDLCPNRSELSDESVHNGIFTSCVTGEGLSEAVEKVENEILRVTGRKKYRLKLPTGSPQIEWLKHTTGVFAEEPDGEDFNFTRIFVVMNEAEKAAFRKTFQMSQKR